MGMYTMKLCSSSFCSSWCQGAPDGFVCTIDYTDYTMVYSITLYNFTTHPHTLGAHTAQRRRTPLT